MFPCVEAPGVVRGKDNASQDILGAGDPGLRVTRTGVRHRVKVQRRDSVRFWVGLKGSR